LSFTAILGPEVYYFIIPIKGFSQRRDFLTHEIAELYDIGLYTRGSLGFGSVGFVILSALCFGGMCGEPTKYQKPGANPTTFKIYSYNASVVVG
jgi:hypothetical protein